MTHDLTTLKSLTQEILGEERLIELLKQVEKGEKVYHYIGYEVSGRPHIGHGILCMMVIKELQKLGIHCRIFIADWHAWINEKLGGDWDLIQNSGVKLFKEYMIAGAKCVGVQLDGDNPLEFITGSELYSGEYYKNNPDKIPENLISNTRQIISKEIASSGKLDAKLQSNEQTEGVVGPLTFWETVIKVSKNTTLARVTRSIDIMGRTEGEVVNFASLIYPPLQAADIFFMGNKIAHGGMDQRKIHVVAIDVGDKMGFKPVAIHHALLLGLQAPSAETIEKAKNGEEISATEIKMSKSKANTAIFMDENEDEIKNKIKKAYCLEGDATLNPILDWSEKIVFKLPLPFSSNGGVAAGRGGLDNKTEGVHLQIKRKAEWGGDVTYTDFETLKADFVAKKLHPSDLKNAVADYFVELLRPAQEVLNKPEVLSMKEEIKTKTGR